VFVFFHFSTKSAVNSLIKDPAFIGKIGLHLLGSRIGLTQIRNKITPLLKISSAAAKVGLTDREMAFEKARIIAE